MVLFCVVLEKAVVVGAVVIVVEAVSTTKSINVIKKIKSFRHTRVNFQESLLAGYTCTTVR